MLSLDSKFLQIICLILIVAITSNLQGEQRRRFLYVAEPGIRNYTQYGGHGVIVFDIDNEYSFVKRIPFQGLAPNGTPSNVKGICGSARTGRLYVSTKIHLICIDLHTDKVLWERKYPNGCDRMSISPDGKLIYQPSYEKDNWYVLNAETGDIIAELTPRSRAHNTVYSIDGQRVYMAGLGSPLLSIADTTTHKIVGKCGPFSHNIRPFTINGSRSLCFVCINKCLGFEVGDLKTGKKLHRVEVKGFKQGPVKRHGCPSHGIAMTPDESEIWLTDGHNEHLHIFDSTKMPPEQIKSIKVREQPGWITFSIDGKTCWPSTGDVIDVETKKITHTLTDEKERMVMSEKLLEVQFKGDKVFAVGDQFGRGMKNEDLTGSIVPDSTVFEEKAGLVAIEAEHFSRQTHMSQRAFYLTSTVQTPNAEADPDEPHTKGAGNGAYLEILPDTRTNHQDKLIPGENFSNEPGKLAVLHYKVNFSNPGRYYVWVRAHSTGSEDNGLHVGLDGKWPESGRRLQWCKAKNTWRWDSLQRTQKVHCGVPHQIFLDIEESGVHEIQFSMREDGFEFDRWLMTKDREFQRPEGIGPEISAANNELPTFPVQN